jgi:glycosyltransferase involved in cell wall biosynthesis
MKIAYLHHSMITTGGVERMIVNKADYLADKKGFDVCIITTDQSGLPLVYPVSEKVKHYDLGVNFYSRYRYPRGLRDVYRLVLRKRYLQLLEALLKELKPDIVICSTYDFTNLCPSVNDGSIKIVESHIAKEFTIDDPHHPLILKYLTESLYRKVERFVENGNFLVTLTNMDSKHWSKITRKAVIPNFLPFYPEKVSTCLNKQVLAVGRLERQKGFDWLVEVWDIIAKKHPDWTLKLYGKGEMKNQLVSRILELGLEKSFLMLEPVSNIADKYAESAIYVMSSRYEGFGMALIESMACGTPVVSFDCPNGPTDIIQDGVDGLLAKTGNIADLAEKVCYLIEHEEERVKMGQVARENVRSYLPEPIMQRWIDLFETLTKK